MRILGHIPHPQYRIVAYTLELHYYVEIEAGPMKQCFKLHKEQVDGMEGLKQWLDEDFLKRTHELFGEMYKNYKSSAGRHFRTP